MIQQPRKSGYLARMYTDRDIDDFLDLDDKETDRLRKKRSFAGKNKRVKHNVARGVSVDYKG